MAADLTAYARDGQAKPDSKNPWLWSSDTWCAYAAGQAMKGMATITKAWKSRGHSVKAKTVGNSVVTVKFSGKDLGTVEVTRN